MNLEACRQQLALALAMLERKEIIDFNGHFSARLPDGRGLMINAADSVRSRIRAHDFIDIDIEFDGRPLAAIVPRRCSFTCTRRSTCAGPMCTRLCTRTRAGQRC